MKTYLKTFILLCPVLVVAIHSQGYRLVPMESDFEGVHANSGTVYVYGSNGVLLISNDGCGTWRESFVDPAKRTIVKVRGNSALLVSLLVSNHILLSTNNGRTWGEPLKIQTHIRDVATSNGNIYVLTDIGISIFSELGTPVREIKDELAIGSNHLEYSKSRLYVVGADGIVRIYDSKTLDSIGSTDVIALCATSRKDKLTSFRFKNSLYEVAIGNEMFSSSDLDSGWKRIGSGATVKMIYNGSVITVNEEEGLWGVKAIGRVKCNSVIGSLGRVLNSADTFHVRYAIPFEVKGIDEVGDSILVAVGTEKSIFYSTNRGLNWDIACQFPSAGSGGSGFRDKKGILYLPGPKRRLMHSTDNGVTWITNYTDSASLQLYRNSSFYPCQTDLPDGRVAFLSFDINAAPNVRLTSDSGNHLSEHHDYYLGSTEHIVFPEYYGFFDLHIFKICKIDFLTDHDITVIAIPDNSVTVRIDSTDFSRTYRRSYDTAIYTLRMRADGFIEAFGTVGFRDSVKEYVYMISRDSLRTWEIIYRSPWDSMFVQGKVFWHGNSIIMLNQRQYLPDFQTSLNFFLQCFKMEDGLPKDTLLSALQADGKSLNYPVIVDSVWYVGTRNGIYRNDGDPTKKSSWQFESVPYRYCSPYQAIAGGFLALVQQNDGSVSNYRVFPGGSATVIDEPIVAENSYLWLAPPVPNPAKEYVDLEVFWGDKNSFPLESVEIFNSIGGSIGRTTLNYVKEGHYNATIRWDCSSYPNGVYRVGVRNGATLRSEVVVIAR